MKTSIFLRLLFFAIVFSSTHTSKAQRTLINRLTWIEFDVPDGKQVFIDSLLANPLYDSVWPVEVDYLPDFQVDGDLEFTLLDYDSTLYASSKQVKFEDEED
nr:hypothetical protein [Bacteroidota bacterium]